MQRRVILKMGLQLLFILLAMVYGMMVNMYKLPPYSLLEAGFSLLHPEEDSEIWEKYTPSEEEVNALISIRKPEDIITRRKELLSFLWEKPELPSLLPSIIQKQFSDERYNDITSLNNIEKLVISMEFGLESHAYHFLPKKPNHKIVLFHQGHAGDFYNSKEQIKTFIDNGYAVIAFSMPLLGLNNQPRVQLPGFGILKISNHDHMKFLLPKHGHPIKYFIEPVVVVLNYMEKNFDYRSISMTGISGGGWTTTLAAAVDTRILNSFPVAGTFPMYLRSNAPGNWGDFEQASPALYYTVNYLDLYILGSHGENRKHIQMFNKFDPCCFEGDGWLSYKDVVKKRVRELGSGEFDIFLDDSHKEHKISNIALIKILSEIAGN